MSAPRRSLLSVLCGDAEIASLLSDEAQLTAMLAFERALAEAEADAGLIEPAAAATIFSALDNFTPDWGDLAKGMARDGVVVPALVRQLRAAIGDTHGASVHLGATSQDAIDTALILQLAKIIPVLIERLTTLEASLAVLTERHGAQKLMAHTRMQAALEFTVADKIRTWLEPLSRHRLALSAMRRELLVIQLGGPVGDRGSFGGKGDEIARHLARRLDLGLAPAWHSARDPIVGFGARLAMLSGTLGKFGADVGLMAQSEVRQVRLAEGGGSSAMPHKSNPVGAEALVTLARYNAGLAGTLQQSMVHENERSGSAWTLEWLVLPQIVETTAASLRISIDLARQMNF